MITIDWTPEYLNFKVSNKSKQAIDADYWNALWNVVIAQGDNNTAGMESVLSAVIGFDERMDSLLDENEKVRRERLPSDVIGTDPYPVGSVYMSMSDTDPGYLFGGTWEQIKDVFLVAEGDNDDDLFALKVDNDISANSVKVYMWKRIG